MLVNKTNTTTIIITVTIAIAENSQGTAISRPVVLRVQSQTSSVRVTGTSWETGMLWLYPRPTKSEMLRVGPGNLFEQALQAILMHIQL